MITTRIVIKPVQNEVEKGSCLSVLVIPREFEKKINRRESAPLQAIFNGSDGNSASIAAGYVTTIVSDYSKQIVGEYLDQTGKKINPAGTINAEVRVWDNPELKTRVFMVPGIVGMLLTVITLILTSLAVVKEKRNWDS